MAETRVKRRERKNITSGVAHVNASFNNTVITITDADGDPVPEARVYVSSDEAGTDVVAGAVMTDKDGATPTLNLDAGTYYRFAEKNGFTFSNPEKITVS